MEQAGLSIRYTPRPRRLPDELDLLMLEQEPWGSYIGVLTKLFFARYLQSALYGRNDEQEPVDCGWGETMALTVYAYPLAPEVHFRLATTCGQMGELQQETIIERQSISFDLATEQTITHPAAAILDAQWLAGPYTTGGARVSAPSLQVRGRSVISPIPLFGSVWLTLEVQRTTCIITLERDEAEKLLIAGWSEFCVGLPNGGRPVAIELEAPPGAEEMAKLGLPCGRGGFSAAVKDGDDGREPVAPPSNKHIKCDYCELKCEGEDG